MAEHGTFGISVALEAESEHTIARSPTGVTAFVGRTLKGPLNRPVRLSSFAEFRQTFGGLWQPSMLSYAVEQYFENGGREAIIVRLANGARPPTLALPAGRGELLLEGVNPGSREYLRAAVDYDGIADHESDRFNLVLQRLRMPGTEQIEDQEIVRRVSIEPGSARFVGDLLLESRIMRVRGSLPLARPDPTPSSGGAGGHAAHYIGSAPNGDDGSPLTNYDVIGSAATGTGLWALQAVEGFDLLCIPPLGREQDVGLATLLVAARFCRERHAMLVVDPPWEWSSAEKALEAFRAWPFRSESAVMFFPRVVAFDRLRNRMETFGSAAAAAGMIARADETLPVWAPAEGPEPILRAGLKLAVAVEDAERVRLAQAGINTLHAVRSSGRAQLIPRTLAGAGGLSGWAYLPVRRLALFVVSSIERGARWLLTAPNEPRVWAQAQAQAERFLEELSREGAFAGGQSEDSFFVICDERVNRSETIAEGKVHLLFGIATSRPAEFRCWLITYQGGSSRTRSVAVNRLATSRQRVEWEIETSILRG